MFAPTLSPESVRLLIFLAAHHRMELHQADVKCAFLNGYLDSYCYLELPDGHKKRKGRSLVWRTKSSIYGLKESPRKWYLRFKSYLKQIGLRQCLSDPCLFTKEGFYLGIYVDDLLFCATSQRDVIEFKQKLSAEFDVNYIFPVKKFLGFEITRTREGGYWISSKSYVAKCVEKFRLEDAVNLPDIPITKGLKLLEEKESKVLQSPKLFQAILGGLLYIQSWI